jgi:hypothetical protein
VLRRPCTCASGDSHQYHKAVARLCYGLADVIEDAAAGKSRLRQPLPCPHRHGPLCAKPQSVLLIVQDLHCTTLRLLIMFLHSSADSELGALTLRAHLL